MKSSNTSFSARPPDCAMAGGYRRTTRASVALLLQVLILTIVIGGPASAGESYVRDFNRFWTLIEQQRAAGHYDSALELALELQQFIAGHSDARPWESNDAALERATLTAILAMPPEARAEVNEADRLEGSVRQHIRNRDFATGVTLAERQLEILRCYFGDQHLEVTARLLRLAGHLAEKGDLVRAELLCRQALSAHREQLGREHPRSVMNIELMAEILIEQGFLPRAEPLCREALALHRKLHGEEQVLTTDAMTLLALVCMQQGRYRETELLMRRALALRRNMPNEYGRVEESLHNLSALYLQRREPAAAEPLLQELLERRRNRLGPDHHSIGTNLCLLGVALHGIGDLASAEQAYDDALAFHVRHFGQEHPEVARDLCNLAALLYDRKDLAGAAAKLHEALAMLRQCHGEEHPQIAAALCSLAAILFDQGHLNQAEACLRQAVAMRRRFSGKDARALATCLSSLASCLLARGDLSGAEAHLREAAELFERARLEAGTGFARATFQSSPYLQLAAVQLERGETVAAWPAAEKGLGRALGDLLLTSDQRYLTPTDTDTNSILRRRVGQLSDHVSVLREALRDSPAASTAHRLREAETQLLAAEAALSDFQWEVAAKYPVAEGQAYRLARIQAALPADVALIGWVHARLNRDEYVSWGYIIRDSGPVTWERLGAAPMRADRSPAAAARHFCRTLARDGAWPANLTSFSAQDEEAHFLYAHWVAPLLAHLESASHLVFLPSGPVLGLPLEALIDEDDTYLVDRFAISYAPSATVYAWLQEHGGGRQPGAVAKALLLGDPPFTDAHLAAMNQEQAAGVSATKYDAAPAMCQLAPGDLRDALRGDCTALARLPRLTQTRREVERIAALIPEATVLVGPAAGEKKLDELAASGALREFETIHLATHALVDADQPARSALILSQVHRPNTEEIATGDEVYCDGLLTMDEVAREWDLNAELVTLSACGTALGRRTGGEGHIGLAQAFLQAGARCLLVSLWKVKDSAAALLMERFYRNLSGDGSAQPGAAQSTAAMSKAAALREAKRWLRTYTDTDGHQPFRHPRQLVGIRVNRRSRIRAPLRAAVASL